MTDSMHQAFRGLNLGGEGQSDPLKNPQQYTTPPRQTGSGSLRSPQALNTELAAQQPNFGSAQSPDSAGNSAAARFERFFPSSPNTASAQHHTSGMASGSMGSAAGLATHGAFGSFGHSLAPGSMGSSSIGSNQFGSTNGARRTPSRAAIPTQWSNQDPALSPSSGGSPPKSITSFNQYSQQQQPQHQQHLQDTNAALMAGIPGADDDVIPTAIVVKNIPFSVKKEQLLQIIEDLGIPMPYAFNYHFDQGIFRGLAFANFRTSEEADTVVAALNGFDVSGRKLRVEYKKVLQAGEKERIEKEKAIKRMQSMQLEKERERERIRQQDEYTANAYLMPGYPGQFANPDPYLAPGGAAAVLQHGSLEAPRAPLTANALKNVPSSSNLRAATAAGGVGGAASDISGGAANANGKREELDLNDAATLEIYSRVLLFRDDRMRDELAFSRSLTPLERRTVHLVAQKLGLFHYSMGEGDERCVVVTKNESSAQSRPLRTQASSIGRSHRSNAATDAFGNMGVAGSAGGLLSPGSAATTGRAGLRMKKSAPDMKRDNDGSSGPGGYGSGYLNPSTGSLAARKSNSNLKEGYSATMGRRPQPGGVGGAAGLQSLFASPFDVPPVPALPGSDLSNHSSPTHSNLLRQPRGPPTPGTSDNRNFAVRSRVATAHHGGGAGAVSNGFSRSNSPPQPNGGGIQLQLNDSPTKAPDHYPNSLTDIDVTTHSTLEI
ncbi:hypothetical protein BCV70DRAFT_197894 [Testicularia cyperi]|uniref:RRM domain-containing protein n=1 Tax=Testicularia cyperi TaxID=1882483 RepID=A0A317Y007_9BASI|nr:hypothetical protein BCV70DRAFT_197894 [Testicularia cyperi]